MEVDHIIFAKWIITGNNNSILENAALIIQNKRIHAIVTAQHAKENFTSQSIHYYDTHAVLPGFINAHTHVGMNLFRGIGDDVSLMTWLNQYIWPAEKKWVSQELVYDASLLAIAEMIRSGTTCFNDMYFFLQATAEAADLAGVRAHIGITVIDFPTAWAKDPDEYIQKGLAFYQQYQNHDRIITTFAPHAIYTVKEPTLLKIKKYAEEYDLKINMHIQETLDEVTQSLAETKLRPLKRLDNIEFVSERLNAIHMTQVDEEDLEILNRRKPNIVHCPQSNMKLASGACPAQKLLDAGINVGLGTDSVASNNDLDMISEMRDASFLAKLSTKNPESLNAETVLRMSTVNGAQLLGISDITGSLVSGKEADFVAINLEQIETQPLYQPLSQIIYAASRNQVTDVWVAGKQLLKNRKLTTLDEKDLLQKAKYWMQKIKA